MKKHIYIIRHAEANSANYGIVDDIDRTLNLNGIADAKKIGDCFWYNRIIFDRIITSSASRALHTGVIVARATKFDVKRINICDNLYLASVEQILNGLRESPSDCNSIALIAHNPGVSDLAYKTGQYINVKTSGVLYFTSDVDDWDSLSIGKLQFESSICEEGSP